MLQSVGEKLSRIAEYQHGRSHRSEYAGLRQPVRPHREYRPDFPRCGFTGGRGSPDLVHPRHCRTGVRHLWRGNWHDRRAHAQRLPVNGGWYSHLVNGTSLPACSILLLLLVVCILPTAVAATTYLTFSPLQLEPEDMLFYNSTGALLGRYNTTSAAIALNDNESYTILVVPSNSNLLANHPDTWFSGFLNYLQTNSVGLIVALFMAAMIIAAIARRR
jgi:hypothetical protein